MESCYHPVLEIQWSCENPPTDFLKAFVILQILLRKFYSDNRIFPFSNYLLYLFTISLVLFDKVGSLFFPPAILLTEFPCYFLFYCNFFFSVCRTCLFGPFGKNHHLYGLLFRLWLVLFVSGIGRLTFFFCGCFSPSA